MKFLRDILLAASLVTLSATFPDVYTSPFATVYYLHGFHSSVSFLDFSGHRNILFESKDMTKVSVETVYSTAQDNVEIFAKQHILIYKSSLYFTYGPTTTESDLEFSHCVNLKDVVFESIF